MQQRYCAIIPTTITAAVAPLPRDERRPVADTHRTSEAGIALLHSKSYSQAALDSTQAPMQAMSGLCTAYNVTEQQFCACREPATEVQCQ